MLKHAAGIAGLLLGALAQAACPPDALGMSRTLTLKREGAAYGTVQHPPLPLAPGEVVLTFDDGPRPGSTNGVLDALAAQCVRATFFMNGKPMQQYPDLAAAVARAGHSVGMHGYEHPHYGQLDASAQLADLALVEDAYARQFGQRAPAFRFPFLEQTPVLLDKLREQGITVMSVDLAIDDWLADQTPAMLTARMLERLKGTKGGIILMHDGQDQTAAALPTLLRALKEGGYKVVHVEWSTP
ncbi:peptidoglycan/xylan/chitin deacetylase (PgdA/CDA1 family) [Pseudoduganella flava]|nr:polysaccharide deacetylase family protein [Pseudoduganella flava]TWI44941.1 peptidoglycan/xylan/chitin deacetylase (PgdA/CDA1 family) [Pseudoduganella flava]